MYSCIPQNNAIQNCLVNRTILVLALLFSYLKQLINNIQKTYTMNKNTLKE